MALFTAMVEHVEGEEAFLQVFWAEAPSLGEALERIAASLPLAGFPEPWFLTHADPYRRDRPLDAEDVMEGVWCAATRHRYPAEYTFRPPAGVICSNQDGEHGLADIHPGYALRERGSSIVVEAVSAAADLLETYLAVVGILGRYRVTWVALQQGWERGGEATFTHEGIADQAGMRAFLLARPDDLLRNGHVTVTAFGQEGSTNVNLTDHKTVQVWTTSRDVANRATTCLRAAGLAPRQPLIAIDAGFHHWHYRPSRSLDRAGLIGALGAQGFTSWVPKRLE